MKINKVEFDNFYSYKHGEVDFSNYNGKIQEGVMVQVSLFFWRLLYTEFLVKAFVRVQRMLWLTIP